LVRKSLAQLAGKQDPACRPQLLKHADHALRDAAYTFFEMTVADILLAYERDKNLAVNSCQCNNYIWKSADSRKALHDISWEACTELNDGRLDLANAFNFKEQKMRALHPDWFKDEDMEPLMGEDEKVAMSAATKADIKSVVEAIGSHDAALTEILSGSSNTSNIILVRLGWIFWFSLGILVASIWH
ncbi:MAG: hypothetical protein K2Q15_06185, partial [Burkholderiales bacterium]|nr:hypothetical protein [Burkholderiales bacterium]